MGAAQWWVPEVLWLSGEGWIIFPLSGSRRRISLSCERLRALLPQFDGRREDMASVLEMSVCFLQLAHSMDPSWEQLSVSPKQAGLVRPLQPVYYGMSWFGIIVPLSFRYCVFCTMTHLNHTSWHSSEGQVSIVSSQYGLISFPYVIPVCGSFRVSTCPVLTKNTHTQTSPKTAA